MQTPPASGVVQVAVNYGPKQNVFASGVATGDGRMILTDASLLGKAREITVAYSDGELTDLEPSRMQQRDQIALLPLTERHGEVVALSPLARDPGTVEIDALIGAAPKAFEVERRGVRARPVGTGASMRWQCTPLPPAFARGGPLLDKEGRLIAVLVLEGGTIVGMPLQGMLPVVEVAAAPPAKMPDVRPAERAASPPVVVERAASPAPPVVVEKTVPAASENPLATGKPATVEESAAAKTKPPAATPTEPLPPAGPPAPAPVEITASLFKDVPVRVTAPAIPKPAPPAPKELPPPMVPDLNLPLRMSRLYVDAGGEASAPPAPAPTPVARVEALVVASVPPFAARVETPVVAPPTATAPAPTPVAPGAVAPTPTQDVISEARQLNEQKQFQKAVDLLEDTLKNHPDAAVLHFYLAIAYWARALAKPDGSPRTNMDKSYYKKAIKSFETFLEKSPDDPLAAEAKVRLNALRGARYGAQ